MQDKLPNIGQQKHIFIINKEFTDIYNHIPLLRCNI